MNQETNTVSEDVVDNVTREQGGQFIDEGGVMFTADLEESALAGEGEAQLHDTDKASVHALQVNMERSGADYVQAQRSFLTNSGAREIHSDSAKLTQSGVLSLHADTVEMKQSSSVIASGTTINASESSIGMANAEKVQLHSSSRVGWLTAGDVQAEGDIHTFLLLSGNVKSGGTVNTKFDAATAGIAAGVFALVLVFFLKIFGKK